MTKTAKIAAFAAALLMTGSAAMADEYLETTGSRNNGSSYSDVYLQVRAPARQATRRHVQAPVAAPANRATEENWFDRADGIPGQGG